MNPINATSARFVRVSLAVIAVLSMLLVPGLGPASGVQAQDPDVAAADVTKNVSASIVVSPQFFAATTKITRNATLSSPPVRVVCWGDFTLNSSTTLAGSVPFQLLYIPTNRQQTQNVLMSGAGSGSKSYACAGSGPTMPLSFSYQVPISGTVQIATQGTETGAVVQANGTVPGIATVKVNGHARLILYAYLPTIAKADQSPSGGPWSDDFSTNKGWKNLSPDECEVELVDGTMRVTLKKSGICWISTPDGVFLSQGTFTVDATRTSDAKGWYGLVFNTTTRLLDERWQFDVAQWSASDGCESGKSKVKLSYKDDDAGNQWTNCTGEVNSSKNEWNKLKVVRSGDNVKAYINDSERFNETESRLKDAGLFDLVVFGDEAGFVVRFDNFDIR